MFDCTKTDLKEGSKDSDKILVLQKYLKDWGYYCSACKIDGIYGPETKKAVAAFQKDNPPLSDDGWFGPKTCPYFVKKVKEENKGENSSHWVYGSDFYKVHPHLRRITPILKMFPWKIIVEEIEVETVEDTGADEASIDSTGDSDAEETGDETATEEATTTPTVTKTTIKRYHTVGLNQKTYTGNLTSQGLNCSNITLRNGSSGPDVLILQTGLASLGYYTNSIDSSFGPKTEAAVKAFQRANGLKDDGIVGSQTCPVFNEKTKVDLNGLTGDKGDEYYFRELAAVSWNADAEGLTSEATVRVIATSDTLKHIRKMQVCELFLENKEGVFQYHAGGGNHEDFCLKKSGDKVISDESWRYWHDPLYGYVNDIKLVQENNLYMYEISICNNGIYLDSDFADYKGTMKQSEHLQAICDEIGLKLLLDLDGLPDEDFEVNPVTQVGNGTGTGSGQTVQMSNNDCDPNNRTESDTWADHRCNPPRCTEKSKVAHGNSSRKYATDTASHNSTSRELVEYVKSRCQYQYINGHAYADNPHGQSHCPDNMWNTSGKVLGNCADFARMLKCICDVNGYKCIICHIPGHFYNAIWENGGWTVCDLCNSNAYGHANHGDVKPTGTWDSPQPRLWY